jgi:hypothetical protein
MKSFKSIVPQTVNLFQEVRQFLFPDVVQHVAGIPLKSRGNRYEPLSCPFHNDKTPSLMVYNDGFHCFGCQTHGDGVDFISQLYDVRPLDAARMIAARFGINTHKPLPPQKRKELREIQRERELQAAFAEWERQAFLRLVTFRDAIMKYFRLYGLESGEAVLAIVRDYVPQMDYYIEILATGTDKEKLTLYKWRVI